ncbi:serine hydrolase domain-containing protein [Amycolatopsis benzoatilytica]|uniref:serine hydrolase domain-containing protein n=1 Tax=Amycolatopsis benzoatilytica TaxID=346045 RepID=UPI0003A7510C|nr:serine hydrolase domain-containing protein [Amycolatopsis benzoatilytica]
MSWNLRELIAKHGVPGAQVAVLAGGEIHDQAAGVLNLRTGVETTGDSVFKVGSITKIWTATLVQQLVHDGVLDLDRPVREYLPGFRLRDPAATDLLTARQLLTHTPGCVSRTPMWHWVDLTHRMWHWVRRMHPMPHWDRREPLCRPETQPRRD